MTESAVVRHASRGDLTFVSQDGYLPEQVVRRKIDEGDVFVATRGGEQAGYLRLERL